MRWFPRRKKDVAALRRGLGKTPMVIPVPVRGRMKDGKKIKKMLRKAFRGRDLYPMWQLKLMAKRPNVDFTAYYNGGKLCGVTYTIGGSKMVYLLYIVVDESLREEGYGTAILRMVQRQAGNRELVLDVPAPKRGTRSYEECKRRIEFYERNGITDTGWALADEDGNWILSSRGKAFDRGVFYRLMWRQSAGYEQLDTKKHR